MVVHEVIEPFYIVFSLKSAVLRLNASVIIMAPINAIIKKP